MATHNPQLIDGVANGVINKGQLVKYLAGGWVACSVAGELADGVAFSDASGAGVALAIQIGGKVKYLCGAAGIADGAKITTTAAGLGVTAATGNLPRLKAYGACAANAYGEAIWESDVTVLP